LTIDQLNTSFSVKLLLWVITAAVIALLFPRAELADVQYEGNIWLDDDLIAEQSFPILKNEKVYNAEVDSAVKSVFQVFTPIHSDSIISLTIKELKLALQKAAIDPEVFNSDPLLAKFSDSLKNALHGFSDSSGVKMAAFLNDLDQLEGILITTGSTGTLNLNFDEIPKDTISILKGNLQEKRLKKDFLDIDGAKNLTASSVAALSRDSLETVTLTALAELLFVPNLVFSDSLTQEQIKLARNKVSRNTGIVVAKEKIIGKHERITPEVKEKLDSYQATKAEDLSIWEKIRQFFGRFLHIAVLTGMLGAFLVHFRKTLFNDNRKLSIFSLLFIAISVLTWYLNKVEIGGSAQLLIVVPLVSLLCTIMFDSRVGLYSTLVTSLIVAGVRGNDYSLAVVNLIAGSFAVYSVRDIQNRQQIYRGMGYIFLGYLIGNVFFSFESLASWSRLFRDLIYSGINSLVSPMLAWTLLRFFEHIFKITTDLTLVDLSSRDQPLLKEMLSSAQGTFDHSQAVSNLAEAAAEKIGAHKLLVKVGGLYHDIGKTISPFYFIENQAGKENIHDNLPPETSARILKEHVLRGIELGKRNNLPQEIINFIATHHGTGLIRTFYDKAVKMYGEENVNEEDFRYEGPRPATREQAIVMLADKCESASRTIKEPGEELKNLINNIIETTMNENELSLTPITLKEVSEIKKVFYNLLITTKHSRIRYPGQEKLEKDTKW